MSLKRTSLALLVLAALGAVAGYAREIGVATLFGAGAVTDAYFVALSLPTVIGDLLVGSALTAAIVPAFAALSGPRRQAERQELFLSCLLCAAGFAALLALATTIFIPDLIGLLAPGFPPQIFDAACRAARFLVWLLPINAALLVSTFALNSQRSYIIPGATWLVANTLFVLTLLAFHRVLGNDVLIAASLAGPVFMLCVNLAWAWRAELFRVVRPTFSFAFRDALRLSRPMVITIGVGSGLGLLMFSHLLVRRFASLYGEGAVSAMSYAFRLYEVPVSLISATVGTLLQPAFSELHLQNAADKLADATRRMLAWGLIVLLPLAALTAVDADLLVRIVFQWGHFGTADAARTADGLRGFSGAIVFETLFIVLFRALYSARRPDATAKIGFATLAILYTCLVMSRQFESLVMVAACLSASFAFAGVASLVSWRRVIARPILPDERMVGRTLIATGLVAGGLAVVKLGQFTIPVALSLVIVIGLAYAAGLGILLPEYWRQLRTLIGRQ